jgi:transcription initiation factor TFIIIB Brf1 subunit/transcription initiation factor TFIIB
MGSKQSKAPVEDYRIIYRHIPKSPSTPAFNILYCASFFKKIVLNCDVFYKKVAFDMKRAEKNIRRRRKHNIKKILDIIFFNDISYDIIQYI